MSADAAAAVVTALPSWARLASPLWPTNSVAVPAVSVQATTSACAPAVAGSSSFTPVGALAARMCLVGSLNSGASEAGAMIWTDGSVEAQETPVIVCVVGLPAASFSVTVRLKGAPPGQVMATQVGALTAATATHDGVAAEPSVTQRLLWPGPSELGEAGGVRRRRSRRRR